MPSPVGAASVRPLQHALPSELKVFVFESRAINVTTHCACYCASRLGCRNLEVELKATKKNRKQSKLLTRFRNSFLLTSF
jgi:hypothetical protein